MIGGLAQAVEHLPSKCNILSSNPSTAKGKKKWNLKDKLVLQNSFNQKRLLILCKLKMRSFSYFFLEENNHLVNNFSHSSITVEKLCYSYFTDLDLYWLLHNKTLATSIEWYLKTDFNTNILPLLSSPQQFPVWHCHVK
jgi:hypothetical protein